MEAVVGYREMPLDTLNLSPFEFVSVANKTHKTIVPIHGKKQSSCHQPLMPMSCNRLAPTAHMGRKNGAAQINWTTLGSSEPVPNKTAGIGLSIGSTIATTMLGPQNNTLVNSQNHQNSLLLARPSNVAYFRRHVETDCAKVI